jgi:adenosine deaminase CECR1
MSPVLEEYFCKREKLIHQDRSLRRDLANATPVSEHEARAEQLVLHLREKEGSTIWSADYQDIPHPFPGMEFLTGMHLRFLQFDGS